LITFFKRRMFIARIFSLLCITSIGNVAIFSAVEVSETSTKSDVESVGELNMVSRPINILWEWDLPEKQGSYRVPEDIETEVEVEMEDEEIEDPLLSGYLDPEMEDQQVDDQQMDDQQVDDQQPHIDMEAEMAEIEASYEQLPQAEQDQLRQEAEMLQTRMPSAIPPYMLPFVPPPYQYYPPRHPIGPRFHPFWPSARIPVPRPRAPQHPVRYMKKIKRDVRRNRRSTGPYRPSPGRHYQPHHSINLKPSDNWWYDVGPDWEVSNKLYSSNPYYAWYRMLSQRLQVYGWPLHSGRINRGTFQHPQDITPAINAYGLGADFNPEDYYNSFHFQPKPYSIDD